MTKDLTITIKVESSAYYAALKNVMEAGNLDLYDQVQCLSLIKENQ